MTRGWLTAALTATLVHGVMVAGLLAGVWDAAACIVGILLDSLAAYGLWLSLYLRRRPDAADDLRMLAKSFVGLSLGVWGFIAIFRAISLRDTAFMLTSLSFLKYLDGGSLLDVIGGGLDEDSLLLLVVLVAAVLLLISLYFFAQILWSMPGGEVASLAICVAVLRVVELLNDRRSGDVGAQRAATAERNLAELCLHVFVKGWVGALVILVVAQTAWPMAWAYLAWSYGHDLLLRPWLWAKFGPRLTRFAALEPARA